MGIVGSVAPLALSRRLAPLGPLALAPLLVACGGAAAPPRASSDVSAEVAAAAAAQGGLASLSDPGADGARGALTAATLKADLLAEGDKVKLDGMLSEWPARTRADTYVEGAADAGFAFNVGARYDATTLYIGGEVTSASFLRTARFGDDEDHASLVLAFGAGTAAVATYEVSLFAGKPGETSGQVRFSARGRGPVPGGRIVEAPVTGGYSFEAAIPWSAFPEARTVRVGLRAAARYYQHDARGLRVAATGPGDARHPDALPPFPTDPEQALEDGFIAEHNLRSQAPSVDLLADVAGDAMKERVQVWGDLLTVCGPGYRGGKGYFFRDLGAPIARLEARPLTGRGKDDLVVVRRVTEGDLKRDWFEVLSFLDKDEPTRTFGQEIAVVRGSQRVDDAVHATPGEIEVTVQPAHGWDASTYREATAVDVAPLLLPWEGVRSQTFRFDGARFTKVRESTQRRAPGAPTAERVPQLPVDHAAATATVSAAPPPTPSATALLEQYRRDHGLRPELPAQKEVAADLDGDGRPERVTLIERDLVVTGPSLGGGHAYTSLTLAQFAAPAEIRELTARDLTGQGAAHVLVRGTRRVTPAGGGDAVEEEVLLIYALRAGALTRVFGIETARAQGGKRVQGLVQFIPSRSGRGLDIDVRPGRATGWTQASYPWPPERPGTGSMEPLLLPWGPTTNLRYAWDGTRFMP